MPVSSPRMEQDEATHIIVPLSATEDVIIEAIQARVADVNWFKRLQ